MISRLYSEFAPRLNKPYQSILAAFDLDRDAQNTACNLTWEELRNIFCFQCLVSWSIKCATVALSGSSGGLALIRLLGRFDTQGSPTTLISPLEPTLQHKPSSNKVYTDHMLLGLFLLWECCGPKYKVQNAEAWFLVTLAASPWVIELSSPFSR